MCGIWARIGAQPESENVEYWVQRLRARGPEGMCIESTNDRCTIGFTRLAINGTSTAGMQPFTYRTVSVICNGEIYNWKDLATRYNIPNESNSDCGILGPLWEEITKEGSGSSFFKALDGVFAFVLVDKETRKVYVGRDPYGVRPFYVGYRLGSPTTERKPELSYVYTEKGAVPVESIYFASELKSIQMCDFAEVFPPGHCASYNMDTLQREGFEPYHTVPFVKHPVYTPEVEGGLEDALKAIRVGLETAVEKRLLSDRPMAALLSGGLDSSLIAALVQKKLKAMGKESLHTFSIGFEGSMDLKMARHVANYIGSEHHEVVLEPEQFWEVVPEVIGDLESYDITTIRASVGNWILGREISKNTPFKVIFNGDGSDEIFGGYKYFQRAPTDESFETESARLLQDIHQYDVLRSDRSMSSHGLEGRTPFLDKQFVAIARSVCTKWRRPTEDHMEKWILRKAFESTDLLPANILWRRKEAFSDGVSNPHESWYQLCQEYGKEAVSRDWKEKAQLQDHLPSPTAEAYYYRQVFQKKYGRKFERLVTPYYWMPRWSPEAKDPSARTLS